MYEEKEPYNLRLLLIIIFLISIFIFVGINKIGSHISNAFDFTYAKAYNLDTVKTDIIKPEEICYVVIDAIDDNIDKTIDSIDTKLIKPTIPSIKPSTIITTHSTPVKKPLVDTTFVLEIPEEEIVVEKVKDKEVKIQTVDSVKSITKSETVKKKKKHI